MPRPRKDYIVLSSAQDATAVDSSYQWRIQPHMFRNWLPGDQMTMKLLSSQFEAPPGTDDSDKYGRSIVVCCDVICSNQEVMGAGKSTLAIIPGYYENTGVGSGLILPTKPGISAELYTDRFNLITISCFVNDQLDITSTTAPATGVARFLLEINYYRDDQA